MTSFGVKFDELSPGTELLCGLKERSSVCGTLIRTIPAALPRNGKRTLARDSSKNLKKLISAAFRFSWFFEFIQQCTQIPPDTLLLAACRWRGIFFGFFFLHFFFGPGSWWLLWLLWLCGFCGFCGFYGFYGSWLLELLSPMAHLSSIDQSISEACSPGACCALDTP